MFHCICTYIRTSYMHYIIQKSCSTKSSLIVLTYMHLVNYTGLCSCYYFIKNRIPCKHMFAVFRHHNEWNWNSLPAALTESTYMVLDVDTGTTMMTCTTDQIVDKDQQPTFQSLPPKITSAHSLKLARRHLHDLLHKCTSVVYMNDNITDMQRATAMAENLYRELIGFATASAPEIPVLVKSTMKRPQIQNKEVLNH